MGREELLKQLGIGRTRLVLALGAAVAAAAAVIIVIPATFGSFSDQTTNTNNSVALGTLSVSNGAGTCSNDATVGAGNASTCAAVVNLSNLKPGDVRTGSVTLTNSGSLRGIYAMNFANFASPAACASNCNGVGTATDLKGQLLVWVHDDKAGTPNTIYGSDCSGGSGGGALSGFTTPANLPSTVNPTDHSWAASEFHSYTVMVCVPSSLGNTYQGESATFDIVTAGTQAAGNSSGTNS